MAGGRNTSSSPGLGQMKGTTGNVLRKKKGGIQMPSMFSTVAQANVQWEADDDFTRSIHPQAGLLRLSRSLSLSLSHIKAQGHQWGLDATGCDGSVLGTTSTKCWLSAIRTASRFNPLRSHYCFCFFCDVSCANSADAALSVGCISVTIARCCGWRLKKKKKRLKSCWHA